MKQTAAIVSVVGVFLIGILVGALAMHLYHVERGTWAGPAAPGEPGPVGMPVRPDAPEPPFARRMERLLDLTEEQKQEIRSIVEESRERADAMREEMRKPVRELMEQTRQSILQVLTPEQQETFRKFSTRERRRAERVFLGDGPPRPGRRPRPPRRTGQP